MLPFVSTSCVHTGVNRQLDRQAAIEGERHALEVNEQSPFDPVEMSWSEAETTMERRNETFLKAEESYEKAVAEKPLISDLSQQFKQTAGDSLGQVLKPSSLLQTFSQPVSQIPEQLSSLGKIKDFSHELEQDAWDSTSVAVEAEIKMREEQIKLHRLLRKGEILEREMKLVEKNPAPESGLDPKITQAFEAWRKQLEGDKNRWLGDVRNLFDAEYQDVRFIKDRSGLPTYETTERPDLSDWPRWCQLWRSRQLVKALAEEHKKEKPAIPGTRFVKDKLSGLALAGGNEEEPTLGIAAIRTDVRKLIQSWRGMKEAQKKARKLESENPADSLNDLASISSRQTIYSLRNEEIQHASVVWLMDEECWR